MSEHAYHRAKQLETVLARITITDATIRETEAKGELVAIRPHAETPAQAKPEPLVINRQFLRGMHKVAFNLYEDLRQESQVALAEDLLLEDDARRERYGLVYQRSPEVPEPAKSR